MEPDLHGCKTFVPVMSGWDWLMLGRDRSFIVRLLGMGVFRIRRWLMGSGGRIVIEGGIDGETAWERMQE